MKLYELIFPLEILDKYSIHESLSSKSGFRYLERFCVFSFRSEHIRRSSASDHRNWSSVILEPCHIIPQLRIVVSSSVLQLGPLLSRPKRHEPARIITHFNTIYSTLTKSGNSVFTLIRKS